MSELCLSSSSTKPSKFSNLILSDLKLFLSFIHSHPLYFIYIIFFSPYLFKLFTFLSPLFITTSLLLLGLLTVFSQPNGDFLLSTYQALKEKLSSSSKKDNENDEFRQFEELELYKIVFDTSTYHQIENSQYDMGLFEALDLSLDEKTVEVDWEESAKLVEEEKILEVFLEPLEEFEDISCYVDEKNIELPSVVDLDKFDVKIEVSKTKVKSVKVGTFWDSPSSRDFDSSFGSYGSMRREKEWTRTLACKLFEERNRSDGEEGMDLLWETYENDSSKKGKKTKKSNTKKIKSDANIDEEREREEESDEVASVQICCLQALKFSTGKMNLGMGRPNIVKISKAIKGFGWLHNIRHSKRGYTSHIK